MFDKKDKRRLKNLLLDTVRMLCKNGLPADSSFRIEATIGISMSDGDALVISFKERIQPDGSVIPQMWSDDEDTGEYGNKVTLADAAESDCVRIESCEMSSEKPTVDDLTDNFSAIESFCESQLLSADHSKYLTGEKVDDGNCSYLNSRECPFDDSPDFANDADNRRVFSSSQRILPFDESTVENSQVFVKLETDECFENSDEPIVAGKQKTAKAQRHSLNSANSSVQFRRNMCMRPTTRPTIHDRPTSANTFYYRRKVSSRQTDGPLSRARVKGNATQVIRSVFVSNLSWRSSNVLRLKFFQLFNMSPTPRFYVSRTE
jgi:hypothetical protein